ncbi:MAG: MBG domain-containing protein, partial [Cyclobacteriaceae bacterium]
MWTFNRIRYFRVFLSLVLIQLPATLLFAELNARDRANEKLFAQDLQVSIGGSPVSSGSTHNFGTINLLSTSSAVTIVLENIGAPEDLNINTISLTGAHSSDFTLNISGLQNTLGSTDNTSFTISFAPTLSGTRTASIEIDSDDPDINPFVINLVGEGVKLNQTITFNPLGAKTYGDASFSLGATASSTLLVSYTSSDPGVATISGSTVTIVGAGSTIITASQVGDPTFNAASDETQTLTINKATPVITWNTPASITYGTALNATQLNANAGIPGTYNYLPVSGTILNAGSNSLNVEFTPTDASNYNQAIGSVNLNVQTKELTVTADNKTRVYNSADPVFTITYSGFVNGDGVGQLDVLPTASSTAIALSPVGSYPITPAGGSDNNYFFTYVDGSLIIDKATPVISWNTPAAITYGTALSATQLNATSGGVAGAFVYTPASGAVLNAGSQTLEVAFTPTDGLNYNSVPSTTVTLTVNKATPVISWSTPAAITYGTALSATQLNATSGGVAGAFVYNPASGAVLSAGSQTLEVAFTPTDGLNYNSVPSTTVTLTVNKATPVISWSTPVAITYGTALSATQLNATSGGVAGAFVYTPASGAVLSAGSQTLEVAFTPTDGLNYNSVPSTTVTLTVNKA